jgi:hypothetical protein
MLKLSLLIFSIHKLLWAKYLQVFGEAVSMNILESSHTKQT